MYFWKCTQKKAKFCLGMGLTFTTHFLPIDTAVESFSWVWGSRGPAHSPPLPFFHSLWVGEEFSTDMVFKLQHPESWILSRDWHGKDPIRLRVLNRTINLLGESQVLKLRAPSLTFISKTTNQLLFFFPRLHLCWWFPLVLKCRETLKCFL